MGKTDGTILPLTKERSTGKGESRKEPVRLSYQDGQVMVMSADQDIFFISAAKAADACRDALKAEERIASFKARFLIPLHHWCVGHADQVAACYIPLPTRHIQVFIITLSEQFDFTLAEEIAALERQLAQSGWRVSLFQLPATDDLSLATFFDPEGALEIYAQRESA